MFATLYFITGVGQISNYIAAFILGNEVLGSPTAWPSPPWACVRFTRWATLFFLCAHTSSAPGGLSCSSSPCPDSSTYPSGGLFRSPHGGCCPKVV
uniref:Major facilitator superfamily (MFS) profile domain-containing protein n=1 Tax=Anguilla anguilla TaxID=7936 RepID=A0A0E9VRR7_ANGAN